MATRANNTHRQPFRLAAPNAKSVLLVGDFTDWEWGPKAMEKGNDGIWTTTVELLPGTHTYRFIVDGDWRDDPECATRAPNPFGGVDIVRETA
jgi:1,4-alpha-glucan branching enzyme